MFKGNNKSTRTSTYKLNLNRVFSYTDITSLESVRVVYILVLLQSTGVCFTCHHWFQREYNFTKKKLQHFWNFLSADGKSSIIQSRKFTSTRLKIYQLTFLPPKYWDLGSNLFTKNKRLSIISLDILIRSITTSPASTFQNFTTKVSRNLLWTYFL